MIKPEIIHKIVEHQAEGMPQKTIAKTLNIATGSVSTHINKPDNKAKIETLRNKLQDQYGNKFVTRMIKEEEQAINLSNHAYNPKEVENKTLYQTPEQIELHLRRKDKTGIDVLKGTDILPSNTMVRFGDDNTQNITISASYQQFLDYQADKPLTIDTNGDTIDDSNHDNVDNS